MFWYLQYYVHQGPNMLASHFLGLFFSLYIYNILWAAICTIDLNFF